MMESITLKVSFEEINLILEALGNLPLVRVSALISNIQKQAAEKLSGGGSDGAASALSTDED